MSEISSQDEELLRYVFSKLDGNGDGKLEFKDVVSALRRSAEVGALLNAHIRVGNSNQETLMRRISKIVYEENQVINFQQFSDFVKLTDEEASSALFKQVNPGSSSPSSSVSSSESSPTAAQSAASSVSASPASKRKASTPTLDLAMEAGSPVMAVSTDDAGSEATNKPLGRHSRTPSFSQLSVVTSPPASQARKNAENDGEAVDNDDVLMAAMAALASGETGSTKHNRPSTAKKDEDEDEDYGELLPEPMSEIEVLATSSSTDGSDDEYSDPVVPTTTNVRLATGGGSPRVAALRSEGRSSAAAPHSPITAASSPGGTSLMRRKMEQQQAHLRQRSEPKPQAPQLASPRRVDALRAQATEAAPHSPITSASSPGGTSLMRRKMEQQQAHLQEKAARQQPTLSSPRQLASPRRVDMLRSQASEPAPHSPITAASSPGGTSLMRRKMEQQQAHLEQNRQNASAPRPPLSSPRRLDALRAQAAEPVAHSPVTAASSPGGTSLMRRKMEQQQAHLLQRDYQQPAKPALSSPRQLSSSRRSPIPGLPSPKRVGALRGESSSAPPHSPITKASSPGGTSLMRRKMEQQQAHLMQRQQNAAPQPTLSSPRQLASPRRVDALRSQAGPPAAHSPITAASSPGGTSLMRRKMEQQQAHIKRRQRNDLAEQPALASPRQLASPRRVDALRAQAGQAAVAHSPITAASSPGGTSLMRRKMEQQQAHFQQHSHGDSAGEPALSSPRQLASPRRVDALRSQAGQPAAAHSPITAASSPGGTSLMRRKLEMQQHQRQRQLAPEHGGPVYGAGHHDDLSEDASYASPSPQRQSNSERLAQKVAANRIPHTDEVRTLRVLAHC